MFNCELKSDYLEVVPSRTRRQGTQLWTGTEYLRRCATRPNVWWLGSLGQERTDQTEKLWAVLGTESSGRM